MTLTDFLSGIANAIRQKTGSSSPIPAPDFADEILGIQNGTDTSDATATAGDILSGKTAYGASGKLVGTYEDIISKIESQGTSVDLSQTSYRIDGLVNGQTVNILMDTTETSSFCIPIIFDSASSTSNGLYLGIGGKNNIMNQNAFTISINGTSHSVSLESWDPTGMPGYQSFYDLGIRSLKYLVE